jgi:peptidoglycan LD-endopeptidase LytH
MTKILFTFLFLLLTSDFYSQVLTVFDRWHKTDQLIRDRKIDKDDAIDSILLYVPLAVQEFKTRDIPATKRADWVFPMSGWTVCTYREKGKDYRDEGFDYFQGGEFKGHPAHDIFILDKDSNGVEDSTGTKIYATAMVTGIVISTYTTWFKGDYLRSGNYVKLFDPESKAIFYYSHLDSVFVNPGQLVTAGEPIAYVGRTGRKAIKGKTHVHIAYYKIEDGEPIPYDIIKDLYAAEKRMVEGKK